MSCLRNVRVSKTLQNILKSLFCHIQRNAYILLKFKFLSYFVCCGIYRMIEVYLLKTSLKA